MFFKKANKIDSRIDTLVGADTRIQGDMTFNGGLRVDGVIIGNVSEIAGTPSTIILSEHGRIEGDEKRRVADIAAAADDDVDPDLLTLNGIRALTEFLKFLAESVLHSQAVCQLFGDIPVAGTARIPIHFLKQAEIRFFMLDCFPNARQFRT